MGSVLMIGATGYIGAAVAATLAARGHRIVAMTRHEPPPGYDSIPGDLTLPGMLATAVHTVKPDAVVHAGVPTGEAHTDVEGVQALMEHGTPLLYTSGIWFLGAVGATPFVEDPPAGDSPRARTEREVLRLGGTVIRPGVVHGNGGGIPAELVGWAREHGTGRHVGPPGTRWATVHVGDLADLYALALESNPGGVLHGVGEEGVEVGAIAAAADVAAGGSGRAEEWPAEDAVRVLGAKYAASLALDQVISSARTREATGWAPAHPGVVSDLREGSYR